MNRFRLPLLVVFTSVFFFSACSSDDDASSPIEPVPDEEVSVTDEDSDPGTPGDSGTPGDDSETPGDTLVAEVDTDSLADNGCQNVVILNEFAYAACETGIEVVDLNSLERNFVSIPADDITGDADLGVIFTQAGNSLTQLDLVNPLAPNAINTVNTNFSIFSGISSANGVLVVSAGSGGSDTEVYTYDADSLTLSIAGIRMYMLLRHPMAQWLSTHRIWVR